MAEQGVASCEVVGSIPYWDQKRAFKSFRTHVDQIEHISLFWYHIGPDGDVLRYQDAREDKEIIRFAREHGVKSFALVANLPDDQREGGDYDWDPDRVAQIISNPGRRQSHIAELLGLAQRLGVDGIHIDYEALPGKLRDDFTTFTQELADALHAEDKLLSIALHPKTSETNPREDNGSHAQDWDALAKSADQLHLMTYGEFDGATHPGPVASPDWVHTIIHYVEHRQVPLERFFVGIPFYAQAWSPVDDQRWRSSGVDLTFSDVQHVMEHHEGRHDSDDYASPSFEFMTSNGNERIVWYENAASVKRKVDLAKSHGMCNFALWRLGGEDTGVWEHLPPRR